jgi:hypothetical protein
MKEVICINSKEVEGSLKVGSKYRAEETAEYFIINFGRVKGQFRKDRFQEIR